MIDGCVMAAKKKNKQERYRKKLQRRKMAQNLKKNAFGGKLR